MIILNIDKLEQLAKWLRGSEMCGLRGHSRQTLAICPICSHVACGVCHEKCPDCVTLGGQDAARSGS